MQVYAIQYSPPLGVTQCFIQRVGCPGISHPLSSSLPPQALLTSAIYLYVHNVLPPQPPLHPKSIMSPQPCHVKKS